jgi:plastocyanin
MRKPSLGAIALVLVASSCMDGGGGDQRTILVDYSHDEFASFVIANFPGEVSVVPGTELVFKQTWTGEPHTVTGGTLVNEMMEESKPLFDLVEPFEVLLASGEVPDPAEERDIPAEEFFNRIEAAKNEDAKNRMLAAYDALRETVPELPDRENPGDATTGDIDEIIEEAAGGIFEDPVVPWAFDETEDGQGFVTQNAGQPCYLTSGAPPKDANRACRDAQQEQAAFDGSHSYYNSGVIPYEGPGGNTYRVQLSEEIDTGSYFFYCAVHGPDQATEVKVVSAGTDVPSQEEISRAAREEISEIDKPLEEAYNDAVDGEIDMEGETLEGPFAGLGPPIHGSINEFVPKELSVEVDEPVRWKMIGADHTITFDVPEYFPIIQFADDGKVSLNPRLQDPAGGAPELPEQEGEGPPPEGPMRIDGGRYDGSGFWSSGLIGAQPYLEYTLRFARPGTYKYACLLHPPMVGTVEVTS